MFIQSALLRTLTTASRSFVFSAARRGVRTGSTVVSSPKAAWKPFFWASAITASVIAIGLPKTSVHLDAGDTEQPDETVDPATSIAFPNSLRIPSKTPLPTFSLLGVGVRTVSFLGIRVYSVGFYADLTNPNLSIPKSASPEEKIEHIVRNSAVVMRIIPTRSTSYGHLRDGFMRALQARLLLCRQRDTLSQDEEMGVQSPMRKFKSMFPNTPLTKHTPLDILVPPPEPNHPRTLIVRDLGAVQNDWLAREFILAYFEGDGISPSLKKAVAQKLQDFGR